MGFDHAEKKELDLSPGSSSRSDASREDEILRQEKAHTSHKDDRRDTQLTADDTDLGPPLKHSHTHTLGVLKFRADDDDDPTDWWFASTAIRSHGQCSLYCCTCGLLEKRPCFRDM
jgi:hypothetical protein